MVNNILFIHANNVEVGGADLCLLKMVKSVKEYGYKPTVILRNKTYLYNQYIDAGIEIIIAPIIRLQKKGKQNFFRYIFEVPKSIYLIIKIINSHHIDFVHTNETTDFYGNIAAKVKNIQSCQHVRWIDSNKLVRFSLALCSLLFSDQIICISEAVKNAVFPNNRSKKIQIIYDWTDLESVNQDKKMIDLHKLLNLDKETKIISCIGRVEHWKGQHVFIKAAELLCKQREDLHFVVVGGPTTGKVEYLLSLQNSVTEKKLEDRISFIGQRQEIQSIIAQSELIVHSSITPEPFGMVVSEAMNQGALVIGANNGGIIEQIENEVSGFLYESGNSVSLAETIQKALSYPKKQELKNNAIQVIQDKFGKSKNFSKLLSIYSKF